MLIPMQVVFFLIFSVLWQGCQRIVSAEVALEYSLVSGTDHSCHIRDEGTVRCWGANDSGQLGSENTTAESVPIVSDDNGDSIDNVTQVIAGEKHSCALSSGNVYCWGRGTEGQLGAGHFNSLTGAVQVPSLDEVLFVSTLYRHNCAMLLDAFFCWGDNDFGQIGDGTFGTDRNSPTRVGPLEGSSFAVSAGREHSCASVIGKAYCWGNASDGRLGSDAQTTCTDDTPCSLTPTEVVGLGENVSSIAAGAKHTCAVVDKAVLCWGDNSRGQLGLGTQVSSNTTPVRVSGLDSGVQLVVSGDYHSCAIHNTQLVCWGANTFGQLGDDSTTDRFTPVVAQGLTSNVTTVSANENSTCAKSAGVHYCWGLNDSGQLGIFSLNTCSEQPCNRVPNPVIIR